MAVAVDACLAAFQGAVARGAQMLITHHGLFWSQHIQITGMHYERIKTLINGNCSLYASHIPLDAHPEVGNNIQLAQMAGLQNIKPWGDHKGDVIGFVGDLPRPLSMVDLNKRLEARLGRGNRVVAHTPTAQRVAVLSGYGVDFIGQASNLAGLQLAYDHVADARLRGIAGKAEGDAFFDVTGSQAELVTLGAHINE